MGHIMMDRRSFLSALALLLSGCMPKRSGLTVGSKNFTEQLVLGELLTQYLGRFTPLPIDKRFYLAGTYICHQALLAGRIDAAHPLARFLVAGCGVHPGELAEIRARAGAPDLVAFNHYPHSERYLFSAPDGTICDVPAVYVRGEPPPRAAPLLAAAASRLGLPLALGEVPVHAPAGERVHVHLAEGQRQA